MKTSVIICTRNRDQELVKCIRSLIAQSLSPDEVIIVDASDTKKTYLKLKEEFQDSKFKYIHTEPALTYQRNVGVRNSSGDIVFFFDDDMILLEGFLKEVVKVFEQDPAKKVGGVMGNIVNVRRHNDIKATLYSVFQRIFLLPGFGTGKFRPSGSPTFVHGADEIRHVQFLSGGLTAYRKEVFKDFEFDEGFLAAHLYTDDEDFSYRVSQKFQNMYTPYAKVEHQPSPIGRDRYYTKAEMTVEARYYLFKKNFPQTLIHTLAFWWSVVGYVVKAILTIDKESIKGVVDGVANIKKVASTYLH